MELVLEGLLPQRASLFWDEPEANINPIHILVIIEMLLELQRNGVQIFISTHDYILAKYFEVKRKEDNEVMFFFLYQSDNGVECERNKYFKDLKENPIVVAFDKLLDEVYDKNLGQQELTGKFYKEESDLYQIDLKRMLTNVKYMHYLFREGKYV